MSRTSECFPEALRTRLRRNPQQPVRVSPRKFLKNGRSSRPLQQGHCLACDTLARHSWSHRVAVALAVTVAAAAIAAEHKLVLMTREELGRELRVARHRVVARHG